MNNNILSLFREALIGNDQALNEANDVLEENGLERITPYKLYFSFYSNDINNMFGIDIETISIYSNIQLKIFLEVIEIIKSSLEDFCFLYFKDKNDLIYAIYDYERAKGRISILANSWFEYLIDKSTLNSKFEKINGIWKKRD